MKNDYDKTLKLVPMPCANCGKVTKIPEYAIYCLDCVYIPGEHPFLKLKVLAKKQTSAKGKK